MLTAVLFVLLGIMAAAALLNIVHAPDWSWAWKVGILVGEYGHLLWLLATGLAVLVGLSTEGVLRVMGLALAAFTVGCLLRPVFVARRIAATLPEKIAAALNVRVPPEPAFSVGRLFRAQPTPAVQVTTEVFSRPEGVELKLDFYRPASAAATGVTPHPCLIVIHGGGWDGGDRTQLVEWNSRWVARGYRVAAISYRLAPRWVWPAQRDDVSAALAWLKANAARLGVDPTRLVLLGRSAGGQLATAVGYGAHDPAIRGVIALYAPHDMPFSWSVSRADDALNSIKLMRQYLGGPPDTLERCALYESASGQFLAQADSPPTLLLHGIPDTLAWYRHSERLAARLLELGVPHYQLQLPWATHGFDFNPDGPGGQLADYAIGRWLAVVCAADRPGRRI
jgi:acetyl esterase/lipase